MRTLKAKQKSYFPYILFDSPETYEQMIRVAHRLLGVFFVLCATSQFLSGQSGRDANINQIGAELLTLIEGNITSRLSGEVGNDMIQVDALYNLTDPKFELAGRQAIKKYQASQVAKDFGLNLKAQYFLNYDPLFDEDENSGETAFGNRARAGLEWELLRGGLLGNQHKAKELRNQQKLESLKYDMKKNDERLFLRYNLIIYFFNEAKIKLLRESQEQVQKELELLYKVYFLKGILYEEILKAKSRTDQIKVQLENYESYNRSIAYTLDMTDYKDQFKYEELPVLEIDLDYLMADATGKVLQDSLYRLEEKVQNNRNRAIDEISLKLQGYQYFGSSNDLSLTERSFLSGGVSLSIPTEILFDGGSRKRLRQERVRERIKFDNYEMVNEKTEIINYYYEYYYKLKTYMEYMYKEMMYQERARIDIVNHKDYVDIHRSLQILRHMDALRSIRLEMIDLKQQMYLLLLKIYGNTHYRSILPAVKSIDVATFYQRLPARRTIVLGKQVQQDYSDRFVVHYLMSNGIERVIVAPGQKVSSEMESLLDENDIVLSTSLSGAHIAGSPEEVSKQVAYLQEVKGYSGVQLDFTNGPDKEAVQQYLLSNIDLISEQDANISIQISKGFPAEFLSTILRLTDHLTIKMDKPSDLDYLRKIASISSGKGKIGILLKTNAFKDRMELEAYIDMVNSVYGIDHVLFDDLDQYMSLDTKTLATME